MIGADRGVSEVIAFLLVFAILLGVSLAGAVYGIETLEITTTGDQVLAAERGLGIFSADLEDLSMGATRRHTAITVPDGTVHMGPPIAVDVAVTIGSKTVPVLRATPTPVVLDVGRSAVVYESGAVLRQQAGTDRLVTAPHWVIDPEQSIVSVIDTRSSGAVTAVSGAAIQLISTSTGTVSDRLALDPDAAGTDSLSVTITITGPRAAGWARGLARDQRFETVTLIDDGGEVRATFTTDALVVMRTGVDVRIQRGR